MKSNIESIILPLMNYRSSVASASSIRIDLWVLWKTMKRYLESNQMAVGTMHAQIKTNASNRIQRIATQITNLRWIESKRQKALDEKNAAVILPKKNYNSSSTNGDASTIRYEVDSCNEIKTCSIFISILVYRQSSWKLVKCATKLSFIDQRVRCRRPCVVQLCRSWGVYALF